MIIASDAVQADGTIHPRYTADGENYSPPLTFSDIPEGTVSLVLIIEDPDAPNGTFTHWTLYDMSPATLQLVENDTPLTGRAGTNSGGSVGYTGPNPPSGSHRYFFHLYALDRMLDLPEGASRDELDEMLEEGIIESAELVGTYQAH